MPQVRGRSLVEERLVDWAVERPMGPGRLPVAMLSRAQKAAELERVVGLEAMTAAYKAELVLGLADDSPDVLDPPPGSPGARRGSWAPDAELPGVSEFFCAELAMALNCGRGTATHLARRAWTWRKNLPGTLAALAAGTLDEPRARVLADVLGHACPAVARAVEAQLLPSAAGLSTGRLRRAALAALLEVDAAAVDARRMQAQRAADVRIYPSASEGMGTLVAELPAPEAAACYDMVDRLARLLRAEGDPRPIGQLRAAVAADLICRPWDTSRPPVTARLHIVAALAALAGDSTEAAEVDGLPITAAHARELLQQLQEALGPGELSPAEGGALTVGITDTAGRLRATATGAQLARLAARGCPDHPDRGGRPEGGCGCPVLDRPAGVDRYRPSAAQQVFVRTRDRTCRFPSCGQRVGWADCDHVVPHARGGPTDCANLCCLCRGHHRLKTHAPGWRFTMSDNGVLTVTTPSGITRTTWPPGRRPPPQNPEPEPGTRPPPPEPPDDDLPPF